MERIRKILAACLLALSAWSCGKDGPDDGTPGTDVPSGITVSPDPVETGSTATTVKLAVTSPQRPGIVENPDWVTVKDGVYDKRTYKITYGLEIGANPSFERREGILVIKAGTLSKTVRIVQEGMEKPDVPEVDKSLIPKAPVNPSASLETKKLYSFLLDSYGNRTLSGVQSAHSHTNDFVDAVFNATGSHPALAGYDFIFLQFSPTPPGWTWVRDYTDISAQKEHWNKGGVITYMWHWNVPPSEEAYRSGNTDGYAFYTKDTGFDIREAVKEGTWQNEFILSDIDEAAVTLKKLQDEGIPVLFRPLHEAAGNYTRYDSQGGAWFWWGRYGAEPCKALWNLLRDRLENHHGLNNLLWVWTIDVVDGFEKEAAKWYPGDDAVDIAGVDVYEDNTGMKLKQFAFANKVTGGKKILALTECGNIPDPALNIEGGTPWSWFLVWPDSDDQGNVNISSSPLNTPSWWKTVMGEKHVYTRENIPSR